MPTPLAIEFSLEYAVRHDEDAKVFVAYLPMLRLFTQSKTEKRLRSAVTDLVFNFVGLCHERGILSDVMRERGLTRMTGPEGQQMREEAQKQGRGQYIMVGNAAREVYEVPITLLAGEKAMATCHR